MSCLISTLHSWIVTMGTDGHQASLIGAKKAQEEGVEWRSKLKPGQKHWGVGGIHVDYPNVYRERHPASLPSPP